MLDAYPQTTKHHRTVFKIGVGVFVVIALAVAVVMLRPLFGKSLAEIRYSRARARWCTRSGVGESAGAVHRVARLRFVQRADRFVIQQSPCADAEQPERFMWQFMRVSGLIMVILCLRT
ncbi:MAG: hypothetical protein U0559_08795 [Anaerolineae bacterium]